MKRKILNYLNEGLWKGIGWSLGVTVGFALVSSLIIFAFSRAGGLPVVGGFFANIVNATQTSLNKNK